MKRAAPALTIMAQAPPTKRNFRTTMPLRCTTSMANSSNNNTSTSSGEEWRSIGSNIDMPESAAAMDADKWRWETITAKSRDGRVRMRTAGYKATSMDQRSSNLNVDCSTACSILSLTIASWLLLSKAHSPAYHNQSRIPPPSSKNNPMAAVLMPSPPTLDFLLRKGSLFWSQFLAFPTVQALSRADGLQDIDIVLRYGCPLFNFTRCAPKAKAPQTATVARAPNASYTAFFRPSFTPTTSSPMTSEAAEVEAMAEACSLDAVWPSIVGGGDIDGKEEDKTYIVGWNAHYFVLHVPAATSSSNIYLIDTLGSRFSADCERAFILKFNAQTRLTTIAASDDGRTAATSRAYESAGDACKEYLSNFLAAYTISEGCSDFMRGLMTKECLYQKLQIDFRQMVLSSSAS